MWGRKPCLIRKNRENRRQEDSDLAQGILATVRQNMWLMHVIALVYFVLAMRKHLDATYPRRWIGHG